MLERLHIGADLDGLNVFVYGAGVSGRAAARLAAALQARVFLFDEQDNPALHDTLQPLQELGIQCLTGNRCRGVDVPCHLAIVSPGIRRMTLLGEQLLTLSAPILSDLSFGAAYCRRPMLAVTGTNGKTTTVEMLTHCLRQAGYDAEACGNIGIPLSEIALREHLPDWLVVEVSSFQLERSEGFLPYSAALLNVTPDHLDRHGSMACYLQEKLKLLRQSQRERPVVVRAELLRDQAVAAALRQRPVLTFSSTAGIKADFTLVEGRIVRRKGGGGGALPIDTLHFVGKHNVENAMAALALAEIADVSFSAVASGLTTFTPGRHRLEFVCERDQVRYINDSKSTNVDALIQALQAVSSPGYRNVILIAGGIDKGCDLSEACEHLRWYVRQVFLIGQCRERLLASWGQVVPATLCASLEDACAEARRTASAGDVVLLSPACASQDMFNDYAHRGQVFSELVNKE